MKRSTRYALFTILLLALFLRLFPLVNTLYWGADYGEYYYLSRELVTTNHISSEYYGWGVVYPDFPGMEIVSSSISVLSDTSLELWLSLIAPLLSSFSVIFIFLIAIELFRDERIGLVAAGFVAVVLPHVYPTSHPMPGAIGDLLFVVCLLLFVKMQRNPKNLGLLMIFTTALIMTHHLSTYFLLICAMGAVFFKALYIKKPDIRNFKTSFIYLAAFITVLLLYWSLSPNFKDEILSHLFPWWILLLIIPIMLIILALFVLAKGKMNYRPSVAFTGWKSSWMRIALILLIVLIILSILVFIGIPGTTMKIQYSAFLIFLPFVVFISFSGPGRSFSDFYREGPSAMGWLIAVIASLFFGAIFAPAFLIPYRHMEYLMIPASFFVGIGIVFMYDLWLARNKGRESATLGNGKSLKKGSKRVAVVLLVVLMMLCNAFFAYPSRDIMLGYNEGSGAKSLEGVVWVKFRTNEDSTIASDHRLSSIIFGFAKRNSTWDRAPLTIKAESFEEARDEMLQVSLPSGTKRVDYVLLDGDVKEGAIMLVWEVAEPLSKEALEKFEGSNYTKLYDNGFTQLYMVNW